VSYYEALYKSAGFILPLSYARFVVTMCIPLSFARYFEKLIETRYSQYFFIPYLYDFDVSVEDDPVGNSPHYLTYFASQLRDAGDEKLTMCPAISAGFTCVKAKFHYASWFGAGSEPVRSWFGAGSELRFGLSSSLLAEN